MKKQINKRGLSITFALLSTFLIGSGTARAEVSAYDKVSGVSSLSSVNSSSLSSSVSDVEDDVSTNTYNISVLSSSVSDIEETVSESSSSSGSWKTITSGWNSIYVGKYDGSSHSSLIGTLPENTMYVSYKYKSDSSKSSYDVSTSTVSNEDVESLIDKYYFVGTSNTISLNSFKVGAISAAGEKQYAYVYLIGSKVYLKTSAYSIYPFTVYAGYLTAYVYD